MRHIKKITLFAFCLITATTVYSHEFTIIYTANTDNSFYPCGVCPASVGGGLTRRSTVINEVTADSKNTIIVDGGNFLPTKATLDSGQLSDKATRNKIIFYLKAMKKMGYSVVGIGDQDTALGEKFLENTIKESELNFISDNSKIKGTKFYYIHKLKNFKVAFIGLSPLAENFRQGEINKHLSKLKKTYRDLRRKADFIVIVSSLGDAANIKLAKKMPEVSLILSSGPVNQLRKSTKVGDTVIILPTPQGKRVNIVNVDFENGKIQNWKMHPERLPLTVKEDPKIRKSIPVCYSYKDCRKVGAMVTRCEKPGTLESVCAYYDAEPINATIITDKEYPFCSVDLPKKDLTSRFLGLKFTTLDYNDKEAKKIIKKHKISSLPAFVFSHTIAQERSFEEISSLLTKSNDVFLAKPELSGVCLLLDRKFKPNKLDLFFAFDEKNAGKVLAELDEFSRKNKIDLNIYLVTPENDEINPSKEEIELALAVKELYPKKFIDYLILRLNNRKSLFWVKQMRSLGIDSKRIESLLGANRMKRVIAKNNAFINDLNIFSGNVILINNNRIFRVFKIDTKGLKKFFDTQ